MLFRKKHKTTEEQLEEAIEALKKGSAEAFRLLYDKYSQKVYRFCLRMLGDEAQAEDAFQETFIRVYENRSNFRGANFAAWLFTIARHTCLNVIRARKEHDQFEESYHAPNSGKQSDVALKDRLEEAIRMLPVALREAFVLREYEECTYQEIADILNIELSLAKVRVYRARIMLRKILKPLVKELNES